MIFLLDSCYPKALEQDFPTELTLSFHLLPTVLHHQAEGEKQKQIRQAWLACFQTEKQESTWSKPTGQSLLFLPTDEIKVLNSINLILSVFSKSYSDFFCFVFSMWKTKPLTNLALPRFLPLVKKDSPFETDPFFLCLTFFMEIKLLYK